MVRVVEPWAGIFEQHKHVFQYMRICKSAGLDGKSTFLFSARIDLQLLGSGISLFSEKHPGCSITRLLHSCVY